MKRAILYFLCIRWLKFAKFLSNQLAKENLVKQKWGTNHTDLVIMFTFDEGVRREHAGSSSV